MEAVILTLQKTAQSYMSHVRFSNDCMNDVYLCYYILANLTFSVDLSSNWTNDSVTVHLHSKPNDAPNLASPSLWFHNVSNTVITGLAGNTPTFESEGTEEPPLSLWAFQTNNEGNVSWSPFISVEDPVWQSLVRPYRPLQAYGRDKAFAAGGTDPIAIVEGMVSFNMDFEELVNTTSANTTFSAGLSRGTMQYIESYGEEGKFTYSLEGRTEH